MHRRRVILFAVVLLLVLTICEASAWGGKGRFWLRGKRYHSFPARRKHIPGFHLVKKLPLSMVAGSPCEWEVRFVNPKSETGWVNITLEITEEHGIGLGEFTVDGMLESYDNPPRKHYYLTLTFEETKGGIFQNQTLISERFNIITLTISSVPNLMPSTYTFTLTITLQHKD